MIENQLLPDLTGNESYLQPLISLYNEDCRQTMKRIPDGSVDLMLTDPPYGTTACDWDIAPNFAEMWPEWERILKPNGAWIFTGSQPFTSSLIVSRIGFFKYEMIWEKGQGTNPLLANKQVMKVHENICVFYREQPTFNPQKTLGKPYSGFTSNTKSIGEVYGSLKSVHNENDGFRNPTSILKHVRELGWHPTQKPLDLFRYLILTFSNKGDTVFDGYSGSGTTAHACLKEGRKFIGSELDKTYFNKSVQRLKCVPTQLF